MRVMLFLVALMALWMVVRPGCQVGAPGEQAEPQGPTPVQVRKLEKLGARVATLDDQIRVVYRAAGRAPEGAEREVLEALAHELARERVRVHHRIERLTHPPEEDEWDEIGSDLQGFLLKLKRAIDKVKVQVQVGDEH